MVLKLTDWFERGADPPESCCTVSNPRAVKQIVAATARRGVALVLRSWSESAVRSSHRAFKSHECVPSSLFHRGLVFSDAFVAVMKSFHQLTRRKALASLTTPRLAPQSFAVHRSWQRNFGATAAAASQLAGLDASKLSVTKTTTPKELTPPKDLVFGKTFTGTHWLLSGSSVPKTYEH